MSAAICQTCPHLGLLTGAIQRYQSESYARGMFNNLFESTTPQARRSRVRDMIRYMIVIYLLNPSGGTRPCGLLSL
jgi:hypothetical protein